jgi:hypothetical protein
MPGNYAHFRFGSELLPLMPPEVRRTVGRFRQLYDMGLHGPDVLLYHDPVIRDKTVKLSSKLHQQTGTAFFGRVCRTVRMNWSEGATAYLYGLLAHYVLDSMCHPYISRMSEAGKATHIQIETEFDRSLLMQDGKTPPHLYDQTGHMRLTPGECQTAALFYPGVSPSAMGRCVKNMARSCKFLTMPQGLRRELTTKAMSLVVPGTADLVMPVGPDRKCQAMDKDLLRLYDMAKERYIPYLEQLQDHLRRGTPLSTDFSKIFG